MNSLARSPAADKPPPASAFLRDVRALLAEPDHWTKGAYALAGSGNPVFPTQPAARSWCLIGATLHLDGRPAARPGATESRERLEHLAGDRLDRWNDAHTHAEVLALLDAAIAKAEAEARP